MTGLPDQHGPDQPQRPGRPGRGDRRDQPGRAAFPGAPASAPSFDDEIDAAVRYEKGLAVKALLALALVALVLAFRVYFFG